jgi:carboxypeptidase Taq
MIGYFPTYALGNLYAAQFYLAAKQAIPDLEARIAAGQLLPLREWLRTNIHRHGRRYRPGELVRVVTGRELSAAPFVEYLNAKFRTLYGI